MSAPVRDPAPPTSWGRALRLGLQFGVPAALVVGVSLVVFDVLGGKTWGEAAQAWPVLLGVLVGMTALMTLLFGVVFGQADRAAARLSGEGVVMHSAASLMVGTEKGGALVLTRQQLLFAPHAFNIGRQPVSVPLDSIREVYMAEAGGYGEAVVYLRGGDALTFRVWDAARWADAFAALGIRMASSDAS